MGQKLFKKAGILRAAFEYQDLVGIELLISFYRDPQLFRWVKLEAEDAETGYLDDVVAARPDGSFDVVQVKFTPEPDTYALGWDWLLDRKIHGTSLIAKWASSAEKVLRLGPINSASLRTNRRPDSSFFKTLNNDRVELDLLDAPTRALVESELGGAERARRFFAVFRFAHSELMIDSFESKLEALIVPTDTDASGWLRLRDQARRWATKKSNPPPDGQITHLHLVQTITKKRPSPISQDFEVPADYCQPGRDFVDSFLFRITSRPISILWGTPGRGKSTFLSWLVEDLYNREIPVIRHHYFLRMSDTSFDRYSLKTIASSLAAQMAVRYGDAVSDLDPSNDETDYLRRWIEACATHFRAKGQRFIVVVDGLDHVWREQGDATHLNHLFNALLPLPDNVSLIVGTQRVADNQLPRRLLQHCSRDDWIEIPAMQPDAVHSWVHAQQNAGRIPPTDSRPVDLTKVADAFWEISLGHPLHLIYSFEALVNSGRAFLPDVIRELPACPEGDIRHYYGRLWSSLSPAARQILHLVAGSPFTWPSAGLRRCVGPTDEVAHLLDHKRSGLAPFHGSVLAFARDRPDHEDSVGAVLQTVVAWLRDEADEFWRWGWLWIMEAKGGDPNSLITRTTRQWVRSSLLAGWPREQIIDILEAAERVTFDAADYARTMELRSLKVRLLNAAEFQTGKYLEFEETAIRVAANAQHVWKLADSIPSLPSARIVALARAAPSNARDVRAECVDELRRRVNTWIKLRHRPQQEFIGLSRNFFEALSVSDEVSVDRLLHFTEGFRDDGAMFRWALECLGRERRFEVLMTINGLLGSSRSLRTYRSEVQDTLVRVAALEGIDLSGRLSGNFASSPLLDCWRIFHNTRRSRLARPIAMTRMSEQTALEYGFHDTFFRTLAISHDGKSPPDFERYIPKDDDGWVRRAFERLRKSASQISSGAAQLRFSTPYFQLADFEKYEVDGLKRSRYFAFTSALRRIATDLHFLRSPVGKTPKLLQEEIVAVKSSPHWQDELWIEDQLRYRLDIWEVGYALHAVTSAAIAEGNRITPFNERAEKWTDLARLAELYGLEVASDLLGRATNCLLGHGWRKDLWLDHVLDAIVDVHKDGAADGVALLASLVPIIEKITEFTDGDETDYVRSGLINAVADVCPDKLPRFYAHFISEGEHRYGQETFEIFTGLLDYSSVTAQALASTVVERRDLDRLVAVGAVGDEAATGLAQRQLAMLGGQPSSHERQYPSHDSDKRDPLPDYTSFGPDQFAALVDATSSHRIDYRERPKCLCDWIDHWRERGRGKEALDSISEYLSDRESFFSVDSIFDHAFQTALALQGKREAYRWLVLAHIYRNGWTHWTGSDEAIGRLQVAARHYGEQWQKYISDSSAATAYSQRRGAKSFVLGVNYLVRFLLLVGQKERAVNFVKSCVSIALEETCDQPIPATPWF